MRALLPALLWVGCTSLPCPDGWADFDGLCEPEAEKIREVRDRIGSGVFGYTSLTTGNCQPGPPPGTTSCKSEIVSGVALRAHRKDDVKQAAIGSCYSSYTLVANAVLLGETVSGEDGVFELSLDPGPVALVATDPLDRCPFYAGNMTVPPGDVIAHSVSFDHAAY